MPPEEALNLERRIKRQFWSQEHEFFAVCAPGLESLCAQELSALGVRLGKQLAGGVEFCGSLEDAYRANLSLRTAGRILLRLKSFRVRNWEDLERTARQTPWEFFVSPQTPVHPQVTLKASNLKHEGRIAQELYEAIQERLAGLGLESPPLASGAAEAGQRLLLRGEDRRAILSMDMSGEHLHRRGYRRQPGLAPLREDLAAGLLLFCGFSGQMPLLDPMCGSGSLALEAALIAGRQAPGQRRAFQFENWPAHRAAAWRHILKKSLSAGQVPACPIYARDISARALNAAQDNARSNRTADHISWQTADFFKTPAPAGPGLVVINPPYGKRLGSVRQAKDFLGDLGRHLKHNYAGWRCGLALYRPEWSALLPLRDTAGLTVSHGGLRITLWRGEV